MRALIVDDSPVMRKVVERALRMAGIELSEVLPAGNGTEALQVLRMGQEQGQELDLIVSDINMPGMNGLQFLEHRRDENLAPGVPCFMVTSEAGAPLVLRAIAAGASGYICKPFTPAQIRQTVVPMLLRALALV
jgi:two-component system chemotaxis response regulator CheY